MSSNRLNSEENKTEKMMERFIPDSHDEIPYLSSFSLLGSDLTSPRMHCFFPWKFSVPSKTVEESDKTVQTRLASDHL